MYQVELTVLSIQAMIVLLNEMAIDFRVKMHCVIH
jgi:hypothetical protein